VPERAVSGPEGRDTGGRGPECADRARAAEEQRLRVVVEALDGRGLDPRDPHRYWLAYRDLACEAEAQPSPDPGFTRDACSAVLAHRRAEELVELLAASSPADLEPVAEARLRAADREAGGSRAWHRWTDQVATPGAEAVAPVREQVREALEARADGALYPPLLATRAWGRCAEPGSEACLAEVRAETRAQRDAVAPPLEDERLERRWRRRWCGRADPACEATIDLLVRDAHAGRDEHGPSGTPAAGREAITR
jgi:hypothetical protein